MRTGREDETGRPMYPTALMCLRLRRSRGIGGAAASAPLDKSSVQEAGNSQPAGLTSEVSAWPDTFH